MLLNKYRVGARNANPRIVHSTTCKRQPRPTPPVVVDHDGVGDSVGCNGY